MHVVNLVHVGYGYARAPNTSAFCTPTPSSRSPGHPMSRTRPPALMLLVVAAPTLITATTLHARGAAAVRERGGAAPLHAAEAPPVHGVWEQ